MILTRNNVPHEGFVYWSEVLPAYPEIEPFKRYELKYNEDTNEVYINTHSGFLGLRRQQEDLNNGEVTPDVLAKAIYEPK